MSRPKGGEGASDCHLYIVAFRLVKSKDSSIPYNIEGVRNVR